MPTAIEDTRSALDQTRQQLASLEHSKRQAALATYREAVASVAKDEPLGQKDAAKLFAASELLGVDNDIFTTDVELFINMAANDVLLGDYDQKAAAFEAETVRTADEVKRLRQELRNAEIANTVARGAMNNLAALGSEVRRTKVHNPRLYASDDNAFTAAPTVRDVTQIDTRRSGPPVVRETQPFVTHYPSGLLH